MFFFLKDRYRYLEYLQTPILIMVRQDLPTRYIDKQKLGHLWTTSADFKGKGCSIVDVRLSPHRHYRRDCLVLHLG